MLIDLDPEDIDAATISTRVMRAAMILAYRATGLGRRDVAWLMACSPEFVARTERESPAEARAFTRALVRTGSTFQACCELGWSEPMLQERMRSPGFVRGFPACVLAASVARRATAPEASE